MTTTPAPLCPSIRNFRDVAGPGYALTGGGSMATGVVYRASAIVPDESDLATLESLGLSVVVDLRTPEEIEKLPDVLPPSVDYLPVDILAESAAKALAGELAEFDPDRARSEMRGVYGSFVNGAAERSAFGRVFRSIARAEGPTIVHCASGKDRTGWAAAVLQMVAGVSASDVHADYLLTNELTADFIREVSEFLSAEMPHLTEVCEILLSVEADYLEHSLDLMDSGYGGVEAYLVEGAGLDTATVESLAAKLRA